MQIILSLSLSLSLSLCYFFLMFFGYTHEFTFFLRVFDDLFILDSSFFAPQ